MICEVIHTQVRLGGHDGCKYYKALEFSALLKLLTLLPFAVGVTLKNIAQR